MFKIRRVSFIKHQAVLKDLQLKTLPNDKPYANPDAWYWLAYDPEGIPVAYAAMALSQTQDKATGVYLARAGVLPQARGQGLQRRLVAARCNFARKLGKEWAYTDTRTNPHSANNLIRNGFLAYDPARPWAFEDSTYWRKRL
jgi:GNAT superfamily N-acetyltransferase